MSNLKNHPSYWLADDAAASLNRYEDAHGKINLTDAGRTVAEQQALINRWYQGGAANRPPYLYKPYEPAASGPHVGGHALDTSDYNRFAQLSEEYGWIHNLPSSDPVHFIYDASRDQHRGGSGGVAGANQVTKDRQNWLNVARGEKLVVDGVEGPATRDAYKRYQTFLRGYGYTGAIDGIWGTNTQAAHAAYYAARNTPSGASLQVGSTGQRVSNLQSGLNAKFPLYSKLAVDGQFGNGTKGVVQEFQRRTGLTADGIVGPATLAMLAKYGITL